MEPPQFLCRLCLWFSCKIMFYAKYSPLTVPIAVTKMVFAVMKRFRRGCIVKQEQSLIDQIDYITLSSPFFPLICSAFLLIAPIDHSDFRDISNSKLPLLKTTGLNAAVNHCPGWIYYDRQTMLIKQQLHDIHEFSKEAGNSYLHCYLPCLLLSSPPPPFSNPASLPGAAQHPSAAVNLCPCNGTVKRYKDTGSNQAQDSLRYCCKRPAILIVIIPVNFFRNCAIRCNQLLQLNWQ